MGSPQSTMARPRTAGMGSCIRIIRLIAAHPSRKTTGAAGNHQALTRSCKRKREAAESARKHTAEKMMKERMRSKAPKQRTSRASPVCSRTALAGVPKRGCKSAAGGEECAVFRHGIIDPRSGHGKRHQAAQYRQQHAAGEDFSAYAAEKCLAELGDEGGVGSDALQRHDGEKSEAEQQIDRGHQQHTPGEGKRKIAPRVAHLTGNLARLPPAAKAEKRAHGSPGNGAKDGFGAGPPLG